jgi:hypothetical protein
VPSNHTFFLSPDRPRHQKTSTAAGTTQFCSLADVTDKPLRIIRTPPWCRLAARLLCFCHHTPWASNHLLSTIRSGVILLAYLSRPVQSSVMSRMIRGPPARLCSWPRSSSPLVWSRRIVLHCRRQPPHPHAPRTHPDCCLSAAVAGAHIVLAMFHAADVPLLQYRRFSVPLLVYRS